MGAASRLLLGKKNDLYYEMRKLSKYETKLMQIPGCGLPQVMARIDDVLKCVAKFRRIPGPDIRKCFENAGISLNLELPKKLGRPRKGQEFKKLGRSKMDKMPKKRGSPRKKQSGKSSKSERKRSAAVAAEAKVAGHVVADPEADDPMDETDDTPPKDWARNEIPDIVHCDSCGVECTENAWSCRRCTYDLCKNCRGTVPHSHSLFRSKTEKGEQKKRENGTAKADTARKSKGSKRKREEKATIDLSDDHSGESGNDHPDDASASSSSSSSSSSSQPPLKKPRTGGIDVSGLTSLTETATSMLTGMETILPRDTYESFAAKIAASLSEQFEVVAKKAF